ncbi:MAG: ribonucleotide reductase N-terminal alpha domain-containing protein, partial [Chloroflexota bacterium]
MAVNPALRSTAAPNLAAPPFVGTRDGRSVPFDAARIHRAIEQAYRAELGVPASSPLDANVDDTITACTVGVAAWCAALPDTPSVEQIQDEVERALMRIGAYGTARRYILYREEHARRRQAKVHTCTRADGTVVPLDTRALRQSIVDACAGLHADAEFLFEATLSGLYPGVPEAEVPHAANLAARAQVEVEPDYTYVAARLLLVTIYAEAFERPTTLAEANAVYRAALPIYIETGIAAGLLDPVLATFDLERLGAALRPERDLQFAVMGMQTIYDRYLLQWEGRRFEAPQFFWLRVAMGLALGESDREAHAIAFYDLISQFLFTPATPTLFNAGTRRPQLSSCFLTTIPDDLGDIYKCLRDNALLSKWSGGLGNDWTNIRALGAPIRGTNWASQGVVPFLKVSSDSAVAVNQGG